MTDDYADKDSCGNLPPQLRFKPLFVDRLLLPLVAKHLAHRVGELFFPAAVLRLVDSLAAAQLVDLDDSVQAGKNDPKFLSR